MTNILVCVRLWEMLKLRIGGELRTWAQLQFTVSTPSPTLCDVTKTAGYSQHSDWTKPLRTLTQGNISLFHQEKRNYTGETKYKKNLKPTLI